MSVVVLIDVGRTTVPPSTHRSAIIHAARRPLRRRLLPRGLPARYVPLSWTERRPLTIALPEGRLPGLGCVWMGCRPSKLPFLRWTPRRRPVDLAVRLCSASSASPPPCSPRSPTTTVFGTLTVRYCGYGSTMTGNSRVTPGNFHFQL